MAERVKEGGLSTHPLEMPAGTWLSHLVVKSCGSHSQATSDDLHLLLYSRIASISTPLGNFAGYFSQMLSLPLHDSSD